MPSDAVEACGGECGGWIREVGDAEAGEDSEGEVEKPDIQSRERCQPRAGGDGEVGEQPESAGARVGGHVVCQAIQFWLGQAIQKEVADDQVRAAFPLALIEELHSRDLAGLKTIAVEPAAAAQQAEHGVTGVNCDGLEPGLLGEQSGQKAAVTVAQDERGSGFHAQGRL